MAKREIFENPVLNFLLKNFGSYPVRRGETDINAIKTTLKLLKEKELVGLFPEGTRIRTGELGEANSGVAVFSIKSEKLVVPVAITGKYRVFSKLNVVFGQPIDLSKHKKDKMTGEDYYELSQGVMKEIGKLKREAN